MVANDLINDIFASYDPTDIVVEDLLLCDYEIVFEDKSSDYSSVSKIRFNKYYRIIVNTKLPWHLRESMLDLFPKVEHYFHISERTNFINMHQLAIEMCRVLGYSDCSHLFTPLKTKNRVKQVREFVDCAIKHMCGSNHAGLKRLDDMPMLTFREEQPVDMRRVTGEHIYSDR